MTVKILELFGGIGACSKALERCKIDYEIADYVEIDKYAVKSYNAIHGTDFEPQDITAWDKNINVDLIMHGSPCQDFSVAGHNAGGDEGSGTRSSLMYETVRIVKKLKPRVVIWENVKNLLGKKHRHNFDKYLEYLQGLGYENYYRVLNAKDYGIPQNRERVFTISIRGLHTPFIFPDGIPLELRLKDMLEPVVDEKFYLNNDAINKIQNSKFNQERGRIQDGDICQTLLQRDYKDPKCVQVAQIYGTNKEPNPQAGRIYATDGISPTVDSCSGGNRMPKVLVKEATKKGYAEAYEGDSINLEQPNSKTRRGRVGKQIAQTLTTSPQQAVIQVVGKINSSQDGVIVDPSGISKTLTAGNNNQPKIVEPFIVASRGRNPENPSDRTPGAPTEQRLEPKFDGTTNTITTVQKDNYVVNADLRIRKLTPLECWRLMGFDDSDFYKAQAVNSNTQLYKQAGNSIVVNVLCEILNDLREVLGVNKAKEAKLIIFETEKFFDVAALAEKEPELFEELAEDYPVEKGIYQFEVS